MKDVSQHEHGVVRVLAVNLPEAEATRFAETRLADALGVTLDAAYVDVVAVSDLAELGLRGLLVEGHGADAAALAADQGKLDALAGVVILMTSKAFRTRPARLAESPEITLIGAYPLAKADTAIGAFQKAEVPNKPRTTHKDEKPAHGTTIKRSWLIVAVALGLAVVVVLAVAL